MNVPGVGEEAILTALAPLNVVPVETVEVPKFVGSLTIPTVLKSFVARISEVP